MKSLLDAIEAAIGEPVSLQGAFESGALSQSGRFQTSGGRRLFVKLAPAGSPEQLPAEAHGLRALGEAGGCRVPEVVAVTSAFLVLEEILPGPADAGFAERFGRQLATVHRATTTRWGFEIDNTCGLTPQPNGWMDGWIPFFRDRRLGHQQTLLNDKGLASRSLNQRLDQIQARLGEWLDLPDEPPALIHGDLWGGNYLVDEGGNAVLIDPAPYYGCREADLAMTELFGGFSAGFYKGYNEAWPLVSGYPERRDLYNLYHVLNHANLFGGGYVGQAERIACQYVG